MHKTLNFFALPLFLTSTFSLTITSLSHGSTQTEMSDITGEKTTVVTASPLSPTSPPLTDSPQTFTVREPSTSSSSSQESESDQDDTQNGDEYMENNQDEDRFEIFSPVPNPLNTVQRKDVLNTASNPLNLLGRTPSVGRGSDVFLAILSIQTEKDKKRKDEEEARKKKEEDDFVSSLLVDD